MSVEVKRISMGNAHDDQKWLVLRGSIEGCPEVTKTRAINTAALADGSLTLEEEKAKLIADVEEYHTRFEAVKQALEQLK